MNLWDHYWIFINVSFFYSRNYRASWQFRMYHIHQRWTNSLDHEESTNLVLLTHVTVQCINFPMVSFFPTTFFSHHKQQNEFVQQEKLTYPNTETDSLTNLDWICPIELDFAVICQIKFSRNVLQYCLFCIHHLRKVRGYGSKSTDA